LPVTHKRFFLESLKRKNLLGRLVSLPGFSPGCFGAKLFHSADLQAERRKWIHVFRLLKKKISKNHLKKKQKGKVRFAIVRAN
jgi:hypothetical protein